MTIREDRILDFDHDYKPANYPPKEEGYYMTIHCGFTGIYYHLNEWKDGKWQHRILDGSYVVAYSRETISKEMVKEWALRKLKHNKL